MDDTASRAYTPALGDIARCRGLGVRIAVCCAGLCAVLYCAALCCAVLCCAVLCCAVLCCAVLCCVACCVVCCLCLVCLPGAVYRISLCMNYNCMYD